MTDFKFTAIFLAIILSQLAKSQVAINTDGLSPNNTSMLDVTSTTKGVLVPRMTTVQRTGITSPATGLLVYDTDTKSFWYYDGGWNNIAAGTSPLGVTSGGTGVSTISGLIKGNGTSPFTVAIAGTDYVSGLANPTGIIGIAVVNGSATTAMRSDAAPAIDVSISPTWTGTHTFNLGLSASGAAISLNTNSNFVTNINTGTSTGAVNIANGSAGGNVISIGNTTGATSTSINAGSGGLNLNTSAATNETTTLGTTGSAVFGSSTANSDKIAILPQSTITTAGFTGTITSADLTALRTWTLPNASGTLALTSAGTSWLVGGNAPGAASVLGTTDNSAVTLQTGTGALNLGTDAAAKTITLGNATGATAVSINSGTGAISLTPQTTGTIVIGAAAGTGSITLGASMAAQSVLIGNGVNAAAQVVSIANGATAANSTVNILSGVGTAGAGSLLMADNTRVTTIDLGNIAPAAARTTTIAGGNSAVADIVNIGTGLVGGAGSKTVNISTGASTVGINTVNIGTGATTVAGGNTIHIGDGTPTGAGSNLVTIGGAALASATTIRAGTGGLNLSTGAATNETTTLGTTGLAVFGSSTANSDKIAILPQSTIVTAAFTGTITSSDLTDGQDMDISRCNGHYCIDYRCWCCMDIWWQCPGRCFCYRNNRQLGSYITNRYRCIKLRNRCSS